MSGQLRTGWTTGACACAAAKSAASALLGDGFLDPVGIVLPRGEQPAFPLTLAETGEGWARAGVVKDAGDDPDVTHGATIIAEIRRGEAGAGIVFRAGSGVGTVTKPGLPLAVGEAAINPVPRALITAELTALAAAKGVSADFIVEISVPGGEVIAKRTWNPRLGILGGISILGTTGVVVPYSCSAWIHSIQRGIDVAAACGLDHVAGCTGAASERAVRAAHGLSEDAIIDMGDFVGGMLKYLRAHPVARVTISGGFAKLLKLAAGHMDLHSKRSQVDLGLAARLAAACGADAETIDRIAGADTGLQALEISQSANIPLGDAVCEHAGRAALAVLDGAPVALDVLAVDRSGRVVGRWAGL